MDTEHEIIERARKEKQTEHHESTDGSIANSGKVDRAEPAPSVMDKTVFNNES